MSTAQKTETKPDTRVRVAGHPLPWRCVHCEEEGDLLFIDDADGKAVFANLDHRHRDAEGEPIVPDSFYMGLVNDVNRLGAPLNVKIADALAAIERNVLTRAEAEEMWSLTATESRLRLEPGQVRIVTLLDDDAIEAMVDAMVKQSTAYPIVPPGYTGKVDRLHPFAARQCLLAALRCRPELADRLPGNPSEAEEAVS